MNRSNLRGNIGKNVVRCARVRIEPLGAIAPQKCGEPNVLAGDLRENVTQKKARGRRLRLTEHIVLGDRRAIRSLLYQRQIVSLNRIRCLKTIRQQM